MKPITLGIGVIALAVAITYWIVSGNTINSGDPELDAEIKELAKMPNIGNIKDSYDARDAYAKGDYQTARELWQSLAASGDNDSAYIAQYGLGLLYANGYGVTQSDQTAREWWQKAVRDNKDARLLLQTLPGDSQHDYPTIHNQYRSAATAGDADAQYKLGVLYNIGIGVKRDRDAAQNWFEQAAAQNHAAAQYQAGKYFAQYSKTADPERERIWYEKAAAQGNADAQYELGHLYADDSMLKETPQDFCRAITLWEQAAAQNQPRAQNRLVTIYSYGHKDCGIAQDDNKARALLEQIIANGDSSDRHLAKIHLHILNQSDP